MSDSVQNTFLDGSLGKIFAKTAMPIILVMAMNGFMAVADALFLGHYVGPDALAAVTLMFPVFMLIVAMATLVANGMSSLLARHLGAGRIDEARGIFASAHGLALTLGAVLIVLLVIFGPMVTLLASGGSENLADLGLIYLTITVYFAPLMFILAVNSDALRNEGRVGLMAGMSLLSSVANIGFNYVLIAQLEMGVAGSAYGTAMAQALAFGIILTFRLKGRTELRPIALWEYSLFRNWRSIFALGAPQSLGFVGLSLGAGSVVTALQIVGHDGYADTITAYGIITRIMTFVFMPLLGLSAAMQSITGNNFGAQMWGRSDASLRLGMMVALVYCAVMQFGLHLFAAEIGAMFVDDPVIIAEVARILPVLTAFFFVTGPIMMIGSYFQAIGDAPRAAILGLSKPYLFAIPLTFGLSSGLGEKGIWLATPGADALMAVLTLMVLVVTARKQSVRWGLFRAEVGQ